jgi:DNA mismatch endonuclease (patch repair protein)
MRAVRQSGTAAELLVRDWLRRQGIAYRIAPKGLPGRPDLANRKFGWALFVHGCFWHAHANCRLATLPKRNAAFWAEKLAQNQARDAAKEAGLRALGLEVAVVWGCEVAALAKDGPVPPGLAAIVARHRAHRCPASSS